MLLSTNLQNSNPGECYWLIPFLRNHEFLIWLNLEGLSVSIIVSVKKREGVGIWSSSFVILHNQEKTHRMRVRLLKQIPLKTSSYLLHAWYMTQPFRIYTQSSSGEDRTASRQTFLNCSYIYHKWLRNKLFLSVDWVDTGPTGKFLGMNRLLLDCLTISFSIVLL